MDVVSPPPVAKQTKKEKLARKKLLLFEKKIAARPYIPVPIQYAISNFTLKVRYIFCSQFMPEGTRRTKKAHVEKCKFEFLQKHFSDEIKLRGVGEWTCCKNRFNFAPFRMVLLLRKVHRDELLPFIKASKTQVRMVLEGDPDLDGMCELPGAKKATNGTKKNKKNKEKSISAKDATPSNYNAVPITYAIDNFTTKFLLAFSARHVNPAASNKKRQKVIRTTKFRFLKKHFRSALKIKKINENWTCCQTRFDALNPESVINGIKPKELMPFVKMTKAEALLLSKNVDHKTKETGRSLKNPPGPGRHDISETIVTSETQASNGIEPEPTTFQDNEVVQPPPTISPHASPNESYIEILPTPPPVPLAVEEIVIPDSDEEVIPIRVPSPEKRNRKRKRVKEAESSAPDVPGTNPETVPQVIDIQPEPSCSTRSQSNGQNNVSNPVSNHNHTVHRNRKESSSDSDGSPIRAKRKQLIVTSDDDEPSVSKPKQSDRVDPIALKPCQVRLDRMSPPGLRETREWKAYKRIRANKPLVVEDPRKLMIGAETVRPRLNSESESDVEFDPDRLNSSAQSSSSSDSVLSNETDSPSSPDTEGSVVAESEEYGASELEEEEERKRFRKQGKHWNKPMIVLKTVEERRAQREQRKKIKAKKLVRRKARAEYSETFMGDLAYVPISIRYAVETVTKKFKWDVFPFGAKVLGKTLGKRELESLSKSQQSTEWSLLKQAFVLKHFREAFRIKKDSKGDWVCCKNTVDFLDCKAFLKLFWNITIN